MYYSSTHSQVNIWYIVTSSQGNHCIICVGCSSTIIHMAQIGYISGISIHTVGQCIPRIQNFEESEISLNSENFVDEFSK